MKKNMRKVLLFLVCIFAVVCIVPTSSWSAEKYPTRPVELVCGMAAGGLGDLNNRLLAKYFEKYLGVPFVTINKPGPSQMMGASYVAQAKPDGYTVGQLTNGIIQAELTGQATGYKMEDLRPICQILTASSALIVRPDSPWKTYQEFVDYAKKNPGLTFGSSGIGSATYMRMETINKYAKLGMTPVHFKGDGETLPMLLGKHVDVGCVSPTVAKTQAEAGKVRILFVWDDPVLDGFDKSIPNLASVYGKDAPDIGTVGYLWVPKKTPDYIVRTLDQAVAKMMKDPEFLAEAKKLNMAYIYVGNDAVEKSMAEKLERYKKALGFLGLLKK